VPVVFFNREPDLASLKTYGKARFVDTNPFDAGVMQGDIIKELWDNHPEYDKNRDGKCQYLMIQANLDNPEALARSEYSVKRARENGVAMSQVGETLLCDWDKEYTREAIRLLFPLYGSQVELIIANNDAMALGAIQALNEFGYNLPNGDKANYSGSLCRCRARCGCRDQGRLYERHRGAQDSSAMGKTIGTMLLNAASNKDFLDGVPYPWDGSGIAIRIPYSRFVGVD
jgi:methyl-galactoside transport system substrate-binding protein